MNITIQQAQFPALEYQGQRAVTFAMIDKAHQRPEVTARATFNRHKRHFIEGVDYVKVSPEEYRSLNICACIKRTRKKSAEKISSIRPAEKLVDSMGQIGFDKYDWEFQS